MFSYLRLHKKTSRKSRNWAITSPSGLEWVVKAEKLLRDHIECKASCTDEIIMFLFVPFTDIRSETNLIFINRTVIKLSKERK